MTKCKHPEPKLKIEIVEDREMTETEVETVASLLFQWWKREFETKNEINPTDEAPYQK